MDQGCPLNLRLMPRSFRLGSIGAVLSMLPGLFVALSFSSPGVLLGVDSIFTLDSKYPFERVFTSWDTLVSGGARNFVPNQIAFFSLWHALQHVFGVRASEEILLTLLVALSGLGAYLFLRRLLRGQPQAELAAVLGGIFYAANPFATSVVWWYHTGLIVTWPAFAFLAYGILRVVQDENKRRAAGLTALFAIVFGLGFTQILLLMFLPFLLLVVFASVWDGGRREALRSVPWILAAMVVGFVWYMAPSLLFIGDYVRNAASQDAASPEYLLRFTTEHASLHDAARFLGLRQLFDDVHGERIRSSVAWYVDGDFGFFLTGIPVAVGFGIWTLWKRGRRAFATALAAGVGIALFLIKGVQPPFAFLNLGVLHLPLGSALQQPYNKIGPALVLLYTIGIALSVSGIAAFSTKIRNVATAALVVLVLIAGLPLYVGQMFQPQGKYVRADLSVVPADYRRLTPALGSSRPWRALELPLFTDGSTALNWDQGAQPNLGPVLPPYMYDAQVFRIKSGDSPADLALSWLEEKIPYSLNARAADKVLSAWGIGSIVLHYDWNTDVATPKVSIKDYSDWLLGTTFVPAGSALSNDSDTELPALTVPRSGVPHHVDLGVNPKYTGREEVLFSTKDFRVQVNPSGNTKAANAGAGFLAVLGNSGEWFPDGNEIAHLYGAWHEISIDYDDRHVTVIADGFARVNGTLHKKGNQSQAYVGTAANARPDLRLRGDISAVNLDGIRYFDARDSRAANLPSLRLSPRGWHLRTLRGAVPFGLKNVNLGDLLLASTSCAVPHIYTAGAVDQVPSGSTIDTVAQRIAKRFACSPHPFVVVEGAQQSAPFAAADLTEVSARSDDYVVRLTPNLAPGSKAATSCLVLGDAFDPWWHATADDSGVAIQHVVANGFENAFIVRADHPVTLHIFNVGRLILLTSFVIGGIAVILAILMVVVPVKQPDWGPSVAVS